MTEAPIGIAPLAGNRCFALQRRSIYAFVAGRNKQGAAEFREACESLSFFIKAASSSFAKRSFCCIFKLV